MYCSTNAAKRITNCVQSSKACKLYMEADNICALNARRNSISDKPVVKLEDFIDGFHFSGLTSSNLLKPAAVIQTIKLTPSASSTAIPSALADTVNTVSSTTTDRENDLYMPDINEIISNCEGRVKELLVSAEILHAQREAIVSIELIRSMFNEKKDQDMYIKRLLNCENVQILLDELVEMSNFLGSPDSNTNPWEECNSTLPRVRIWSRQERERVYSLRVVGVMNNPMPQILAMLADPALCKDWFPMTGSCDEILHHHRPQRIGTAVNYIIQNLPWPVTNREWLVQQCVAVDDIHGCVHLGQRSIPEDLTHVSQIEDGSESIENLRKRIEAAKLSAGAVNNSIDPIKTAKSKTANVCAQLSYLQRVKLGLSHKARGKIVRGEMLACGASMVPLDQNRTFVEARLCTDMKMALPGWLLLQMTKQVGQDAFIAMEKLSTFAPKDGSKKAAESKWKWDLLEHTRSTGLYRMVDKLYENACIKGQKMTDEDRKKEEERLLTEAFIRPEMNRTDLLQIAEKLGCLYPHYL